MAIAAACTSMAPRFSMRILFQTLLVGLAGAGLCCAFGCATHFDKGLKSYRSRDYPAARSEFLKALEDEPEKSSLLRTHLAESYLGEGNYGAAFAEALQVYKAKPSRDAEALVLKVLGGHIAHLLAEKKYEEAAALLDEKKKRCNIALDPLSLRVHDASVAAARSAKRYDEALAQVTRFRGLDLQSRRASLLTLLLEGINFYYMEDQLPKAFAYYQRLKELGPGPEEIPDGYHPIFADLNQHELLQKVTRLTEQGDYIGAAAMLRQSPLYERQSYIDLLVLGLKRGIAGDIELAAQLFHLLAAEDPSFFRQILSKEFVDENRERLAGLAFREAMGLLKVAFLEDTARLSESADTAQALDLARYAAELAPEAFPMETSGVACQIGFIESLKSLSLAQSAEGVQDVLRALRESSCAAANGVAFTYYAAKSLLGMGEWRQAASIVAEIDQVPKDIPFGEYYAKLQSLIAERRGDQAVVDRQPRLAFMSFREALSLLPQGHPRVEGLVQKAKFAMAEVTQAFFATYQTIIAKDLVVEIKAIAGLDPERAFLTRPMAFNNNPQPTLAEIVDNVFYLFYALQRLETFAADTQKTAEREAEMRSLSAEVAAFGTLVREAYPKTKFKTLAGIIADVMK